MTAQLSAGQLAPGFSQPLGGNGVIRIHVQKCPQICYGALTGTRTQVERHPRELAITGMRHTAAMPFGSPLYVVDTSDTRSKSAYLMLFTGRSGAQGCVASDRLNAETPSQTLCLKGRQDSGSRGMLQHLQLSSIESEPSAVQQRLRTGWIY